MVRYKMAPSHRRVPLFKSSRACACASTSGLRLIDVFFLCSLFGLLRPEVAFFPRSLLSTARLEAKGCVAAFVEPAVTTDLIEAVEHKSAKHRLFLKCRACLPPPPKKKVTETRSARVYHLVFSLSSTVLVAVRCRHVFVYLYVLVT